METSNCKQHNSCHICICLIFHKSVVYVVLQIVVYLEGGLPTLHFFLNFFTKKNMGIRSCRTIEAQKQIRREKQFVMMPRPDVFRSNSSRHSSHFPRMQSEVLIGHIYCQTVICSSLPRLKDELEHDHNKF